MIGFPQTVGNLTESSTGLYELIKSANLTVYPDDEIRLAIGRCIAVPSSRGWKISKEKQSHKIDVVVALAMAAPGAMQYGARGVIDFAEIKRLNDNLHSRQAQRDVVSAHYAGKFYNNAADADAVEHLEHGGEPMGVQYTMRAPRRFGGW